MHEQQQVYNITFNILDGSDVYIQSSQSDILAEIRALKRDVHTLHNDHKVLQDTVKKGAEFDVENSSFKVDNTITQTFMPVHI